MAASKYYSFDILPRPTRVGPKYTAPATVQYNDFLKYKEELAVLAKAKRLKLGSAFKVIFILPVSKKLPSKEQMRLMGEPHTTGGYALVKLVEALRQALLGDDDIHRVEASKYWGEKGKIIIKNITIEDFEYLRQIK